MSSVTEVMFDVDLPCNDWSELDQCPYKDMSETDGQHICFKCGHSIYINQDQVELTNDDVFGRLSD